jgi:hypothetical protein
MGGSHSKTKYKTAKKKYGVIEESDVMKRNLETLARWEEKLSKHPCPIRKWDSKKDFVPMSMITKKKGNAEYYVYTRADDDDDDDNDQGLDQFCLDETIPSGEVYLPIHESDRFGKIVVAWDPDKPISENLRGQQYLLNDKIIVSNTFIWRMGCMILLMGYEEGEPEREEEGEEEEGEEVDPETTDKQLRELDRPSLIFEWETNKKSIILKNTKTAVVRKIDHKTKYNDADRSKKDVFILNENRKIEFYTFEEIKYLMRTNKMPYINECLSYYYGLNPNKYARFATVSQ